MSHPLEWQRQIDELRGIVAEQTRLRQEAQESHERMLRAKMYAEDRAAALGTTLAEAQRQVHSLTAQVEASKVEKRGKVERQRQEIARLNEEVTRVKKECEARVMSSAREAQRMKSERDAVRGEVVRLNAAILKLAGHGDPGLVAEVARLQSVIVAQRTLVGQLARYLGQSHVRTAAEHAWGSIADTLELAREVAGGSL